MHWTQNHSIQVPPKCTASLPTQGLMTNPYYVLEIYFLDLLPCFIFPLHILISVGLTWKETKTILLQVLDLCLQYHSGLFSPMYDYVRPFPLFQNQLVYCSYWNPTIVTTLSLNLRVLLLISVLVTRLGITCMVFCICSFMSIWGCWKSIVKSSYNPEAKRTTCFWLLTPSLVCLPWTKPMSHHMSGPSNPVMFINFNLLISFLSVLSNSCAWDTTHRHCHATHMRNMCVWARPNFFFHVTIGEGKEFFSMSKFQACVRSALEKYYICVSTRTHWWRSSTEDKDELGRRVGQPLASDTTAHQNPKLERGALPRRSAGQPLSTLWWSWGSATI